MTPTYPDAWPLTESLPVWGIWTDFHLLWMQHILLTASQLWVFEEIREPHRETKETHLRRFRLQSASNSSIQWRRVGRSRNLRMTAVIYVWCYCFIFCRSDGLLAASFSLFPISVTGCTHCFQTNFKLICFCLVAISFPCALLLCNLIDLNYFIHPWGGEKAASLEWWINCIFCSCW